MSERVCDFCKSKESIKNPLISGNDTCICKNCIIASYNLLFVLEQDKDKLSTKVVAKAISTDYEDSESL